MCSSGLGSFGFKRFVFWCAGGGCASPRLIEFCRSGGGRASSEFAEFRCSGEGFENSIAQCWALCLAPLIFASSLSYSFSFLCSFSLTQCGHAPPPAGRGGVAMQMWFDQPALAYVLHYQGVRHSQTACTRLGEGRLDVRRLWEPQLLQPPVVQQSPLHHHGAQARGLDLPKVQQPQLLQEHEVQHSLVQAPQSRTLSRRIP